MLAHGLAPDARGSRSAALLRRFAGPVFPSGFWAALWAAALVAELIALSGIVFADEPVPGYRALFRLLGGVYVACGLIGWRRRPDSYSGPLMVAVGFGLLVEPVFAQFDNSALALVGDLLEDAWGIPAIALLLSFPNGGRLQGTADRVLVGAMVVQLGVEVLRHLFLDREGNALLVAADADTAAALGALGELLSIFACLGTAVVIFARWRRASLPRRRAMWPSVAGVTCLLFFAAANSAGGVLLAWLAVCSLLVIPAAFLAGLLRSRLARGGVSDLFAEIRTLHGPELQARLAQAAGDPSLVIAYEPVTPSPGRAVARLEGATLVYDPALDEDPGLVEVVAAAAEIALEQERLQAKSQRLIAAGDVERRRLERDLHDGAQQRLVMVAIQLRLIEADIRRDPAAAEARVSSASDELARSLEELRDLARGIHPAVLEHGLASALTSLSARSAVPTAVDCDPLGDVPRPVELALYFVACEALANIAKYAQASAASVRLSRTGGGVAIEIADDGVGGAVASGGSGLRGLQDRVEALRGHLLVTSPVGAGTVVSAELPCAS